MTDAKSLEQDAIQFATRAVQCDQKGLVDTAVFYYGEAAQGLLSASMAGSTLPGLLSKVNEYVTRAEQLRTNKGAATAFAAPQKTPQQLQMERAGFLIGQAFEQDEAQNIDEALELYTQAAEICLELRQDKSASQEVLTKVTKLAQQALDRAEDLKSKTTPGLEAPSNPQQPPRSPRLGARHVPRPLGFSLFEDEGRSLAANRVKPPASGGGGGGAGGYTREEIQVLKTTSSINGREFVPFLDVDLREKFAYPVPFADKNGFPKLSPKQKERFGKWARPDDFYSDPAVIYAVSSYSIKQTIVSDCSFVASLAISAQYERKFRKKLITSIIYPQNRKGEPVYNPCGKYMVKFNLNGVPRKVIIDDYLPLSKSGDLLCSYSNNKNELWVSLLEKAYLKVMGGYDFPGSNSNIDLHALTGWIPERIAIRTKSDEFNSDHEFDRLHDRYHKGHCLITLATGDMTEDEADRAGLVPTHAYALLDIRKVQDQKLMQLKNPWSHCRWKGNFSEKDVTHWTTDMKAALNFDPKNAELIDNGIFWIDYESILRFYDVIYINWNPELFQHTTCVHHTWTAKDGPKRDSYNISDNPQFRLEVKAPGPSAVWILLTRHITDKDDFANNKEFITVLVYKTNGKRIYYPYDPPPHKDGVRINSPHYLCKMVEEKGNNLYSLVISQYEKSNTIHFTLRVYATCDFKFNKIADPYNAKYAKQVTCEWKGKTAGGCSNYKDTYTNNPIHQIRLDNNRTDNMVLIELRGPKQYSVGFEVTMVSENITGTPYSLTKKSSGDYRRGFCVLELENLPGGVYNIRPCTFYPDKEGPYFLDISSSVPVSLTRIQ